MDNKNKNDQFPHQQGSGSAENTGRSRDDQKNKDASLGKYEKQQIAGEMGKGPNPLTDVRQMGGLSGRDDNSGGSGDQMENENTNEPTER